MTSVPGCVASQPRMLRRLLRGGSAGELSRGLSDGSTADDRRTVGGVARIADRADQNLRRLAQEVTGSRIERREADVAADRWLGVSGETAEEASVVFSRIREFSGCLGFLSVSRSVAGRQGAGGGALTSPARSRLRVSRASGGDEGEAGEGGEGFGAGSLHDRSAMIFDRALADAEIGGDVLAGMAGQHPLHDVALPRREPGQMVDRGVPPLRRLARIRRQFQGAIDAVDQLVAADGLLDEVRRRRPSSPGPPSPRRCCR